MLRRAALLACLFAIACDPPAAGPDGGEAVADAGLPDAGAADAGPVDAGAEPGDAGLADAGADDAGAVSDGGAADAGLDAGLRPPLDGGHGVIRGGCGRVAPQLLSPAPSFFEVHLDFGMDQFDDPVERSRLTPGAQQILMEGTAGGSSGLSEAFAYEVLALCEGASLVKSETTIVYNPPTSKKTDILVSIDGKQVGVSVVRAFLFPGDAGYPVNATTTGIIRGKLSDILVSSANVVPPDNWVKQVLAVVSYEQAGSTSVEAIWNSLDAMTRANTIVYVIVTDGADKPLYFNCSTDAGCP